MIGDNFTRPVRKWVKKKIENTYIEIEAKRQEISDKETPTIYLPYLKNSDSYIIPKQLDSLEKCEFGLPIPPKNLWLGYGNNSSEYLYGKEQVTKMLDILKQSEFDLSKKMNMLDFGCGAGRMIRWLKPFADKCEIWGTDISAEHINWANQYLRPPFNFATTTTNPHLPFEDRYFDVIYAGSVFTHIDDLAEAWLLEMRRILKPDGRLYFTIQDKHSIEMLNTIPVYKSIWLSGYLNSNEVYLSKTDDFNVFVGGRGPISQVFYDIDFFCDSLKTIFRLLSVTQEAYGFQTGVLLTRK